jgi:hypothetical protein
MIEVCVSTTGPLATSPAVGNHGQPAVIINKKGVLIAVAFLPASVKLTA